MGNTASSASAASQEPPRQSATVLDRSDDGQTQSGASGKNVGSPVDVPTPPNVPLSPRKNRLSAPVAIGDSHGRGASGFLISHGLTSPDLAAMDQDDPIDRLFSTDDLDANVCGSPLISRSSARPSTMITAVNASATNTSSNTKKDDSSSRPSSSVSNSQGLPFTPLLANFIPPSVSGSFVSNTTLGRPSISGLASKLQDISSAQGLGISTVDVQPPPNQPAPKVQQKPPKRTVVPTLISWTGPTRSGGVYVTGTFNDWKQKIAMHRDKNDYSFVLNLKPGMHKLKFIVDGEWKCSHDLDTALDVSGNLVNYIDVKEEDLRQDVDEILRDDSGSPTLMSENQKEPMDEGEFTQKIPRYLTSTSNSTTPSASLSYSSTSDPYLRSMMMSDSYSSSINNDYSYSSNIYASTSSNIITNGNTQEDTRLSEPPPTLPPQLERIVLNSSNSTNTGNKSALAKGQDPHILGTPNHVCINHLYALSIRDGVMGLACTRRYKAKYVTTVFYRPVISRRFPTTSTS
eukprot:Partr_v1_DN26432_c0_g1_i1_m24060 putative Protein kinase, AMP-activated, beta